ncbi:hypothetical protein GQ600_19612 [Phytophthora cactorum]|nr:hypothetical protein GQ600_19612 [Phytophthora cactorum]
MALSCQMSFERLLITHVTQQRRPSCPTKRNQSDVDVPTQRDGYSHTTHRQLCSLFIDCKKCRFRQEEAKRLREELRGLESEVTVLKYRSGHGSYVDPEL